MFRSPPLVALFALIALAAACGDDAAAPTTSSSSTTIAQTTTSAVASTTTSTTTATTTTQPAFDGGGLEFPPPEVEGLAAIFDPVVASLGYRVGRGVLIDRETYRVTADGNHLALYLEPLVAKSADEFAGDFMPIVRLFTPAVFDAWPGLDSFDVCQEPFDWEGDTAPPGITVFDIDRQTAETIDWGTVGLADLLELAEISAGLTIHAVEMIHVTAEWTAAREG
jgi:hypothetical protein